MQSYLYLIMGSVAIISVTLAAAEIIGVVMRRAAKLAGPKERWRGGAAQRLDKAGGREHRSRRQQLSFGGTRDQPLYRT